ncbi:unnamed protein product [Mytilus edulis]|uniref:VWFA domain-containing protein n=1 Tax=Mytilus edulis TaxID=6550 RepID=A0A8S3UV04_MYTED|nr:unnamed protein product [Mytilus edulis]
MNLIDVGSIFSIGEASEILHVGVNESKLNDGRINEIMKAVEPFIYGSTPLFQALNETWKIFADRKYTSYEKVLFVLSDGEPTDRGDIKQIVQLLERYKVTVVSCYINRHSYIQPRRLYSVENGSWNKGAKFLFKLSSTISSQLLPRTIFIKTGWEIDIDNNETKLFLQINHEDNIHDACSLAKQQEYSTCYANATATVLHLSMMRIIGRDGGHPTFNALRNEIIKKHGIDGAYPFDVLEGIAPKYRLQFQTVSAQDAMIAVASKRPVIASFYLTNLEWKQFSAFYERQPTGILSKAKIDLRNRDPRDTLSGHAVVLTSFNSKSLRFMNSWGSNWANMGFFRVQNSEVLDFDYIDVFWTLNDLSEQEIKKFEVHGAEVACKLINNLKSLQKSVYRCPICRDNSLVTAYSGSLKEAVCPKCKGIFQCNDVGNILALNIYLTSLIR